MTAAQRSGGHGAALLHRRYADLVRGYVGPIAALALLIAACFTLPIHRAQPYGGRDGLAAATPASRAAATADYPVHVVMPALLTQASSLDFRIPAIRRNSGAYALMFWLIVNSVLLITVSAYWIRAFRAASNDRKLKRFALRLIFTIPAFAGLMAASVIVGSDLGGSVVAATLGTAGAIASALLIATVLGRTASTIAVALTAAVMGLMNIFPAWATVAMVTGALAGQYAARSVRSRTAVIRCAAFVMGAGALGAFVAALATGRDLDSAGSVAMQALLTGCLGAALWFTLLTIMERPFELTTPLGLLELLDPTRPILERFAREAPGTFAHSLMVGHLAASAAEAVGADALLCRVAAQYHDLGKLCRAQFFRENQQDENVHDRLAPSLSAIVVSSHVRDGETMAKEIGLPPVIQDIITQHHGTTLMQYFFYRASATSGGKSPSMLEHQFRYPGPKPQSKEAGIMMLADAIEAASRTLAQPTRAAVRELIDRIVDDRIDDHQLDECPLTLKDITTIRSTFAEVVCAMLHQRISYPGLHAPTPADADDFTAVPFDFYEDFDPAVLLQPAPEGLAIAAPGLDDDCPDAQRAAAGRESLRRRARRRTERPADR